MHIEHAHIDITRLSCVAVMTQHFAQKCLGDVAHAVMSEHFAAKAAGASFNEKIYYRYC